MVDESLLIFTAVPLTWSYFAAVVVVLGMQGTQWCCHSGAGRNPAVSTTYWIPGQARHDDVALTGQQWLIL